MAASISTVLRRTARAYPDKPAIVGDGLRLTYAELDTCVDALAGRLRAAGVGPGTRVGLAVQRGALAVAGPAAVLRLGGVYVPLSPDQPPARLASMVRRAGVEVALTDDAGAAVLDPGVCQVPVGPDDLVPRRAGVVPDAAPGPDGGAYLMFTSGSTGQPKGVLVPHACVHALLRDGAEPFGIGADEVVPLQHGYGFDISVWEVWGTIAAGATLVAVTGEATGDVEYLAELLLRHPPTRLHIVPTVLSHLAETLADEGLQVPVRTVVIGGEAVNYAAVAAWNLAHPLQRPRWLNGYGITETTVYNTVRELTEEDLRRASPASPIGTAFAASPAVVLDDDLRPVPAGSTGEIVIGGAQVAWGYIGDPELTAERFVTVPGRPGRWYRTGDLGYAEPDGGLRYLGRRDDQVKVRGHRIELGEIDHALRQVSWVREGAATLVESARGEPVLVACVAADPAGRVDGDPLSLLRATLADLVPQHMLPNRVMFVDQLPRNSNGKTDRKALTAIAGQPVVDRPLTGQPVAVTSE